MAKKSKSFEDSIIRDHDQAAAKGRRGGLASARSRAEKKTMREWALLFRDEIPTGEKVPRAALAVASMFDQARAGNVHAFRALSDILGETETVPPTVQIESPIVLGVIPRAKVEAAKARRAARMIEG